MRFCLLLTVSILLLCSRIVAQSSELKIWARMTFDEEGLKFQNKDCLILPFPVMEGNEKAGSYLALRHYPGNGVKSRLKPLAFSEPGCEDHGRAIKPGKFEGQDISDGELLLLFDHIGDMPSAPDLMIAFKLFVPKDDVAEYRVAFWNYTQEGKKADILIKPPRGQWNLIRLPLHVPNSIDMGDIVRNITLRAKSSKPYRWIVDDIVVWSGEDRQPPSPVKNVTVKADGNDNILSWLPATDNLAIAAYEIHRGTVIDFKPSPQTLIGKTAECHFRDFFPMHEDSFYRIITIDYAENSSTPTAACQRTAN